MISFVNIDTKTAFALDSQEDMGVTDGHFDVVFPTNSYFQSVSPTLIAANSDYLIVYDDVLSKLFVRSNQEAGTWSYDVEFESVTNIFALGNSAFIFADNRHFLIDLSNKNATVIEHTLSSPTDISYFNSDGTYLYAKSTAGYISVYDQNLDIVFGCDNHYNDDLLAGKPVVAGENDILYAFTIAYGNPFFVKYDLSSGQQYNGIGLTKYVQKAFVGDVIYALESTPDADETANKNIIAIDKENGDVLFCANLNLDDFFAFGNTLFSIEGKKIVIYTLSTDKTTLIPSTTISMSGSDINHLDNPTDVAMLGNDIVVADSANNRLSILSNANTVSTLPLDFAPINLATHANKIYVSSKNKICKIVDGQIVSEYPLENIVDITYLDKLYILANDGVYTLLGGAPIMLCQLEGGRGISTAQDGTNIYIMKDDEIATITRNGQTLPPIFVGNTQGVVDFEIDYLGNVTLVYESKIAQYFNSTLICDYPLANSTHTASINGAYLNQNTLYFATKECFVGKCKISAVTKDTFVPPTVDIDNTQYQIAICTNENAVYLPLDQRIEGAMVSNGETMLIFNCTPQDENLAYALINGKFIVVNKDDFQIENFVAVNENCITTSNTTLYTLPSVDSDTISIEDGTILHCIATCDGLDNGKWLVVRMENDERDYFVEKSALTPYTPPIEETQKVFGKANADRVGGLVNVYQYQDSNSQVIAQIVDGTKVEVLETLENYYLVNIDGKSGYVEKDQLVLDGLTTVQIVAIILSILVVLAGSAIFASIHITRKNANEKNQKLN